MEISQLRTFYEIAKAGNYADASHNLSISKSAMSHQIKNLESDLNIKLFQRQGNRRTLTEMPLESFWKSWMTSRDFAETCITRKLEPSRL
jgi:DNA-binding transcriptional LysR family regulator